MDLKFDSELQEELELSTIEENEEQDDFELKRFSFNSYKIERSIRDIIAWIEREKIEIPKFQRKNVWTYNQSARFIESILLGLPTPDLFMYRKIVKGEEKFLLIDGFQRISTIRQFTEGFFENPNGDIRSFKIPFRNSNWSGKSYNTLDEDDVDYINDYSLKISVFDSIDKSNKVTENNLMTSIFERINTGSTTLTTQEIRHAVYFGEAAIKLGKLASNEVFIELINEDKTKNNNRRSGEEFYLRLLTYSFAYTRKSAGHSSFDDKEIVRFFSSKKIMLNNFLNFINMSKETGQVLFDKLSNKINDVLKDIHKEFRNAFYAYSLVREKMYNKVYEPFAEAIVLVSLKKGIPKCTANEFDEIKSDIWIKFEETKETSKLYKEFFENTTSLDNVIKRVDTLEKLLYRE